MMETILFLQAYWMSKMPVLLAQSKAQQLFKIMQLCAFRLMELHPLMEATGVKLRYQKT